MALFEKKDDIFELMEKFEKSSIAELELEIGADLKIKLSKNGAPPPAAVYVPTAQNYTEIINAPESAAVENGKTINAPIIGTFYSSPSPEAAPYVKAGDKLSKGAIVCILEAMKVMNEIECEQDCEILEVLVSNGELVEYGQPLFKIK
jgi:acetyl-CoA carboxylase biotin carboxyl carrier protein